MQAMILFQQVKDRAKATQDRAKPTQDQAKTTNKVDLQVEKENDVTLKEMQEM
jgi:hypothetical protein